jgi:hypothetical protein
MSFFIAGGQIFATDICVQIPTLRPIAMQQTVSAVCDRGGGSAQGDVNF